MTFTYVFRISNLAVAENEEFKEGFACLLSWSSRALQVTTHSLPGTVWETLKHAAEPPEEDLCKELELHFSRPGEYLLCLYS